MKKLVLILCLFIATADVGAVGLESRQFTPYFNMRVGQGAYLPNQGAFFTGANMNLGVGLLSKITDKHVLFALYNLDFRGQAFQFPNTQEFDSKSQAHLFSFEYRWNVGDRWRVRPSVAFGKTYTQTAAAEVWGHGLYDDKSAGLQLAGDYTFPIRQKDAVLTPMISRYVIRFPNYSDILREFRGENANTGLAGGLKDQVLLEYSLGFKYAPWRAKLRFNTVDFKSERVVQASATYGTDKQADSNVILEGGMDAKLWILETSPQIRFVTHKSNQNFLLFQSATDATPAFAGNYYGYKEVSLGLPVFLNMTKNWAASGELDLQKRTYDSRHPRDSQNQFVSGRQSDNMVTLSAGLRKRMNDVSAFTLTYSVTTARSNNKFERYLPSSYTGQGLVLAYQLTY
jgi:hypothetical protein